jgi:hypothetical protein
VIPGFIVTCATFPGVIVHESAHLVMCRLRRVPVLDVCYFRFGNPSGYVIHGEPPSFGAHFLISLGPFLVNSLLCLLICLPILLPLRLFGYSDPLIHVLMWLGVSIGMHAFPSTGDAAGLWRAARAAAAVGNPLAIVSFPLVIVIYVANALRILWFDLLYGLAIGVGLPLLLIDRMF